MYADIVQRERAERKGAEVRVKSQQKTDCALPLDSPSNLAGTEL